MMIRFFGLYLMTENELMELDEKWFVLLPDLRTKNGGLIEHEAPGKWKWCALLKPEEEQKP